MKKNVMPKMGSILLIAGVMFQVLAVFVDFYHHVVIEHMTVNDFLFGDEGIFSPQHMLLPVGLVVVVAGTVFLYNAGKK